MGRALFNTLARVLTVTACGDEVASSTTQPTADASTPTSLVPLDTCTDAECGFALSD